MVFKPCSLIREFGVSIGIKACLDLLQIGKAELRSRPVALSRDASDAPFSLMITDSEATSYKIRPDDDNVYILLRNRWKDEWSLESFRGSNS
jgi:hypothetical protein